MTFLEWFALMEKARTQYIEGAITARELFNYIIARAVEVDTEKDSDLS